MNHFRPLKFATLAALAVLGCSDTAYAQPQLTVTPLTTAANPLIFNNIPSGGVSASQPVTVATQNSTTATVIVQADPSSPWIQVRPNGSVNVPATFAVQCNTTNLSSGSYNGSFTVSVDGSPTDSITVYVSLTVTGLSALSATPPTLQFSGQAGATNGTPASAQVLITSNAQPMNYTLQVSYGAPASNWLLLSTTQGSTSGPAFSVGVNPSVLTATLYPVTFDATIVARSTTSSDTVVVGVQLTINSNATISATPANPPPFLYQAGAATDPAAQQLTITAGGGSNTFSIQESPAVSWLVVSPLSGTASSTPDVIALNAIPREQGLTPATYNTNLIVTPTGEAALAPIPVTLVVAAHPLIQLSTNALSFTASFGGAPTIQSVIVSSSGNAPVGFTASSNEPWLVASASASTTPATLTVQVNPASLSIQSYTGIVTVAPTNGDGYTETITVSLNVTGPSQLVAGPNALLFSYQIGQSPAQAQTVELSSTGQPLAFSVSTTTANCGSSWLQAQPVAGTTSATLTVSVVTAGMAAGDCSGVITLNYQSGTGPASLNIPVTLAVSNSPELSISMIPDFGVATAPLGSNPFQQQISLISTSPTIPVDYSVSIMNVSGGAWLGVAGATAGLTPQNLLLQISPGILTIPGSYSGTVVVTSRTLAPAQLVLTVTLTITTSTTVTIAPQALTFSESQGGTPPAAQALTLASCPGTATYTSVITYLSGANWLQISPTSGNASGSLQVSVLPNTLPLGQYNAQISFAFQDSATTSSNVNVTLNVLPAQTVAVSPSLLSFTYQLGSAAPASQSLAITSTSGSATVAVSANSIGWLAVNSTGGATPQTITVSVNPQGLSAQTYNGSISVSAPGVLTNPITVPVSLLVSTAPAPQPINIINNANGISGIIAPGEELAITGNFLGPATPVLFALNSSGGVSSMLAGVQVFFDNNPGIPIYVSANQIDVMVPYEINGRISTQMVVQYQGASSQVFPLAVATAAPGLFTDSFSGSGQVAAINQNASYNGASGSFQPAPRGSVIALYGTGGGQTNPPSVTGSVTPIPTDPSQLLTIPNVTATVGGVPATVNFAGAAPGEITGVMQINVVIPPNVTPGNAVPVTIAIGGTSTPIGTTIAVQ